MKSSQASEASADQAERRQRGRQSQQGLPFASGALAIATLRFHKHCEALSEVAERRSGSGHGVVAVWALCVRHRGGGVAAHRWPGDDVASCSARLTRPLRGARVPSLPALLANC